MGCFGVDDTAWVGVKAPEGWKPSVAGEDEWGCVWSKTDIENMGQVKGHPLSDFGKLASFRPPDYRDASRYVGLVENLDAIKGREKYVISGIFMVLSEPMHTLHGFEDTLNVVNLQQPRASGIREMGERYRGRIAFQSLADIQATLPTGDRQRVAEDAELLMENWATPKGGFIFSDYGSNVAIGVKDSAIKRFMYDEFSRRSQHLYGDALPPPV